MIFVSLALFIKNYSGDSVDLWMQVRDEDGPYKGYWELPGGNIEEGESALEAVIREVAEEVGIDIPSSNAKFFNKFRHGIDSKEIEFFNFIIRDAAPSEDRGKWFTLDLKNLEQSLPRKIPPANIQIFGELSNALAHTKEGDFEKLWTL